MDAPVPALDVPYLRLGQLQFPRHTHETLGEAQRRERLHEGLGGGRARGGVHGHQSRSVGVVLHLGHHDAVQRGGQQPQAALDQDLDRFGGREQIVPAAGQHRLLARADRHQAPLAGHGGQAIAVALPRGLEQDGEAFLPLLAAGRRKREADDILGGLVLRDGHVGAAAEFEWRQVG